MAHLTVGQSTVGQYGSDGRLFVFGSGSGGRQRGLRFAAVQLREDMSRLKDRTSSLASPVETPR